jgi:hypothetical protein
VLLVVTALIFSASLQWLPPPEPATAG